LSLAAADSVKKGQPNRLPFFFAPAPAYRRVGLPTKAAAGAKRGSKQKRHTIWPASGSPPLELAPTHKVVTSETAKFTVSQNLALPSFLRI
jgi:hypothetical protein